MTKARGRIWVLSELYYPEETSTGHYVTRIAEHWARQHDVSVLCVQPSYSKAGVVAARRERHNGVEIHRCPAILPRGKSKLARVVRLVSVTLSLFFHALIKVRRGDCLFLVTNPPSLPVLASAVALLRGIPYIVLVYDLYPQILAACGLMQERSLAFRVLGAVNGAMLRRAARVVGVGRDQVSRIVATRGQKHSEDVRYVPLWADCGHILPASKDGNRLIEELSLSGKFVVLHAGNMSYPQGIETIADVVRRLADDPEIHFVFIGSGAKRPLLQKLIASGATNLTLAPEQPRSEQQTFLNAADVALVSLKAGMSGISVPSRTYNIMAAGKPIIGLVPPDSEVARTIANYEIGWVVGSDDAAGAESAVRAAKRDRDHLPEMGRRAREAAETVYSEAGILRKFDTVLEGLI